MLISPEPWFCHLTLPPGWLGVTRDDSWKSVISTRVCPSFFTHAPTALSTWASRRSKACRWSSVRTGVRGSLERDSLITSLRRYSDRARSVSLTSVERLILGEVRALLTSESYHIWWSRKILTCNTGSAEQEWTSRREKAGQICSKPEDEEAR